MRRLRLSVALCLLAGPCIAAPRADAAIAHWTQLVRVPAIVDLAQLRPSGAILVDTSVGLESMRPGRKPARYAPSYVSPGGNEPYVALAPPRRRGRCSFGKRAVYLLRLVAPTGVTAVDQKGRVRQFARIPGPGLETGITFDQGGRFRHRLLVTVTSGMENTLYSVDCHGHVAMLARHLPPFEGGMVVAPRGFGGHFGGRLIAPDELSGHVYAIAPNGAAEVVAGLNMPVGQDVGVESLGFVPRGFGAGWRALVADRATPGNPHPGNDAILSIPGSRLAAAGVRPGDLLAVNEGGATTVAIRCRGAKCRAHRVADGPATAHVEGHVVFARR